MLIGQALRKIDAAMEEPATASTAHIFTIFAVLRSQ